MFTFVVSFASRTLIVSVPQILKMRNSITIVFTRNEKKSLNKLY